jgi:hypothetical protein
MQKIRTTNGTLGYVIEAEQLPVQLCVVCGDMLPSSTNWPERSLNSEVNLKGRCLAAKAQTVIEHFTCCCMPAVAQHVCVAVGDQCLLHLPSSDQPQASSVYKERVIEELIVFAARGRERGCIVGHIRSSPSRLPARCKGAANWSQPRIAAWHSMVAATCRHQHSSPMAGVLQGELL